MPIIEVNYPTKVFKARDSGLAIVQCDGTSGTPECSFPCLASRV
jgi:hypothetical protein